MTYEDILYMADEGDVSAMVVAVQEFVWNMDEKMQEELGVKDKILGYVMKAIDSGNARAMNQLGAMYAEGKLVAKDPIHSFYWYKAASERGFLEATCNLGFNYLYGIGTEKDYEMAYKTFSKAAVMGAGDAVVRIGDMYMDGKYVEKDPNSAYLIYLQAQQIAENNLKDHGMHQVYSDVMLRIGNCHFYGLGVEKDTLKAINEYSLAVHYYQLREESGDAYSAEGYRESKEMLKKAVAEL